MAEKEQQSPIPLAPANYGRSWSDAEAANGTAAAQRKSNKRKKCLLYALLFAIFQTGIILAFTFTVFKIRTPKLRVQSATLESSNLEEPENTTLRVAMSVKNSNFGRFKFERTLVYFHYNGIQVAVGATTKGRANWRSTKNLTVVVDVKVPKSAELERDLSSGVVELSSRAEMKGNVRVAMLIKKKRSAFMNCTMQIVREAQQLRNIVCH